MLNTYTSPTRPTCISRFWIFLGCLLRPTSPLISILLSLQYLYFTPTPQLLSWRSALSTCTSPTPDIPHLLPLVSAPRSVCPIPLPFPRFYPPHFRPQPAPRSLPSPGDFSFTGPYVPLCPYLPIPMCAPLLGIFWFLVSFFGFLFCARVRVQGASTPWQSLVPALSPPLLDHAGAVLFYCL